jgi:hypothetical protein
MLQPNSPLERCAPICVRSEEGDHAVVEILLRLDAEDEVDVAVFGEDEHDLGFAPERLDGAQHVDGVGQGVVPAGGHPERERFRDSAQVVSGRGDAQIMLQVAEHAVVVPGEGAAADHLREVREVLQRGGVRLELEVVRDASGVEAAVGPRDGG